MMRRLFAACVLLAALVFAADARASVIPGIAAGGQIQNSDPTTLLNTDQALGSQWLRFDINWAQIQAGGSSSYSWAAIDAVAKGAVARGMKPLGVIVYTPSWARPSGTSATYGPAPSTYAAFVSKAVRHYAALGVHAYEIWNEPNVKASWTPQPSPSNYTALLKAAYTAVKGADLTATVITGGTSPAPTDGTNYSPADWISGIYANGGHGSFDAVAAHPYCWPAYPGDAKTWSAWYQMYGTSPSMRNVMVAHGDSAKRIWATEFGAPTNGPSGSYVSEDTQAAMITRAFQVFSGYSWAGPLFIYSTRDLGTSTSTRENFFGLERFDGSHKPSYSAYKKAAGKL